MRGNPGAELAAYRCATASRNVLMTPAFVPSRRTVKDGVLFVNGVPLSQSEVAEYLHIPLGTVKTRTRSALARLADLLEGELS